MLKSLIGLLAISLVAMLGVMSTAAVAESDSDLLRPGHPDTYLVVKGDTLWGIAGTFLNEPWLWPQIWHINEQIKDPHWIYPGDLIKLVYISGQPKLTVDRSGRNGQFGDSEQFGDSGQYGDGSGVDGFDQSGKNVTMLSDGTVRLSPKARVSQLDSVIPAIPLDVIQSFLVDHRVVDSKKVLEDAPYVLAGGEEHILMGIGDKIYARGSFPDNANAYGVYRGGELFIDPDNAEVLGYEAMELGLSKLVSVEAGVATLRLLSAKEDVRIGDRLLPTVERKVNSIFYPKSPKDKISGRIIHVFGGVRNVSQYSVVVLNRGDRDNLGIGDVLAVYRQGAKVRDRSTSELIQLPAEKSGLLIVFRTFEKLSFGLILTAERTLMVLDEVRNP